MSSTFRTALGEEIFHRRYAQGPNDTWNELARRLVEDVCGTRWGHYQHALLSKSDQQDLVQIITSMKFIPAGRYVYYAGRQAKYFNNCLAMIAEDTREGWAKLLEKITLALMCGAGVGVVYSPVRPNGRVLSRTGGVASGPIPLMRSANEIGRNVMQGGSRRSALWAGLSWDHEDIQAFITEKDWSDEIKQLKAKDYNFPAPLDMTNISVLFDERLMSCRGAREVFDQVVWKMCQSGEPGLCFNMFDQKDETLRNACNELISEHNDDVCNLGSINLGRIENIDELKEVVTLASKFLVCGTLRSELPYDAVRETREEHRKIGLGLMGVHEWLMRRGMKYEVTEELHDWLDVYSVYSQGAADEQCTRFYLSRCERYQAVAPSGTISILAGTTSGIEPLLSVAVKRRYLVDGTRWKYQYIVDPTAQYLINELGKSPDEIETAYTLTRDPERRIKFQADIQQYVDMGISSTINLPEWGSEYNNEDTVKTLSDLIYNYSDRLRGITCYPNNARSGQTITEVPYSEAMKNKGVIFDASEETCKGSICEL